MRGRYVVAAAWFVCFGAGAGCFNFGDLGGDTDAASPGSDGSSTDVVVGEDAPSDAATGIDAPSNGCPSGRGPAMVRVPTVSGTSYCIDSTEVTRAQYKTFLDSNYPLDAMAPLCTFNTTFTPSTTQNNCPSTPFDPAVHPNYPVVCVDWCDALGFCAWAGKRLCGAIDSDGGPASFGQAGSAEDEWYSACSDGGASLFPYGNAYDASTCKGAENPPNAPVAVGSLAGCTGGYAGVFDMSGNVWEYEDNCGKLTPDASTTCLRRGGSFEELSGQLNCGVVDSQGKSMTDNNAGFRCCAD